MKQKWVFSMAVGMGCLASAALAQTTAPANVLNSTTEQPDAITAEKNLVPEDKAVEPAEHDFMPSPANVPQEHTAMPATSGAELGAAPAADELNSTQPDSITPSSTKGPFYNSSQAELRSRKFFRGAGNVFLCVGEIPNQMFQEAYRTTPVTGVIVGAGKGVIKGGKRLMIGMWEMVTFYNPGKNNYKPYVQPEVVFGEYLH